MIRLLLAAAFLPCLLLPGCSAYYAWNYTPDAALHALHVQGDSAEPRVETTASLIGILRATDVEPRRLHARLAFDHRGATPIVLRTADARAIPAGRGGLAPAGDRADVTLAARERRTLDLYFDLDAPTDASPGATGPIPPIPNDALRAIDLTWTLVVDGRNCESRARFGRVVFVPAHDPWCEDPWSWHHHRCGPGWRVHTGFWFTHLR